MKISSVIKNILPYGISNYFLKKKNALYARENTMPFEEPPIFNDKGQKLKTAFLKDYRARNWPYSFVANRYPEYLFWDRFNYGLHNHFYSHEEIKQTIGKPVKKFAFLLESEIIDPETYFLYKKHPGLIKEFDLLFTHSSSLLEKYDNAVFIPGGGVYCGTLLHGGTLHSEQFKSKTKNISLVSSHKTFCELHKFRLDLARYYKKSSLVDTFGTFDGGQYIKISDSLEKYRYSFAVENDITSYRFTEKILNCFASMTVPIYIGAAEIGKFFNPDGIIQIPKLEFTEADKIVKMCCEKDYHSRLTAIIDNFNRVQNYLCIEDYIWKNYCNYFV